MEFKEIVRWPGEVRKRFGEAVTNIVPNETVYTKALREGKLSHTEIQGNHFLIEEKDGFYNLHFAVSSDCDVIATAREFAQKLGKPLVTEHIVREGKDRSLGTPQATLKRMVHAEELTATTSHKSVREGTYADIPKLLEIFNREFDPLTERLPDADELRRLIDGHGIFIADDIEVAAADGRETGGFIAFERAGRALHLRYWWVDAPIRGKGVGSRLMDSYIEASKGTTRQFLWVFADNENAIKRYRHYGFEFDGTADEIYITR